MGRPRGLLLLLLLLHQGVGTAKAAAKAGGRAAHAAHAAAHVAEPHPAAVETRRVAERGALGAVVLRAAEIVRAEGATVAVAEAVVAAVGADCGGNGAIVGRPLRELDHDCIGDSVGD